MPELVDSHCHLTLEGLAGRLPEVLSAMSLAGVRRAVTVCTTLEEFDAVHALALRHASLWATVGVHPDQEDVQEPDVQALLDRAKRPRVVAVGETGLDYYRAGSRTRDELRWQRDRFAVHIAAARASGLPLVVHTRAASEDTLAMLAAEGGGAVRGVFHCFTESRQVAFAALDLGFDISFSGILTFRNAADLHDVARDVPLSRCLIETDSPYLAPVPHRGRPNEPAYVVNVASRLAELKGLSFEAVAHATTANADRLFGWPAADAAASSRDGAAALPAVPT